MYARHYTISLCRHEENFSGLRFTETMKTFNPSQAIKPTKENVKRIIQAMFPDFTIDERWQTIREQITDGGLDCFAINLRAKNPIDFESWYVEFLA